MLQKILSSQRIRSKPLWAALASLLFLILKKLGLIVVEADYWKAVDLILMVAILAGILNDPTTTNTGILDDLTD